MSSDPRARAMLLAALLTAACNTPPPMGPKPPVFPNGGLLAQATPPPAGVLKVLDGLYQSSSRFGADVVLHANQDPSPGAINAGGLDSDLATLAILARDHAAFALLRPGCFTDQGTTKLVLEGYWRYMDSSSTGLVRLFVQPDALAFALCAGQTPAPIDLPATFTGATGYGSNEPYVPLQVTYTRARKSRAAQTDPAGPAGKPAFFVGAHHGACQDSDGCGVSINTPGTSILADALGADYFETDVRLSADGLPISFHMPTLGPTNVNGIFCYGNVSDYTYAQLLANCRLLNGEVIPTLEETLTTALTRTQLKAIWLDMKTADTVVPTAQVLARLAATLPASAQVYRRVVMGLPDSDLIGSYDAAKGGGQLSPLQRCLIEDDPSDVDRTGCEAWSPRFTRGPLVGEMSQLQSEGHFVGYWTISDVDVLDAFLTAAGSGNGPNGILTNYLGLLNQRWEMVGIAPRYPVGSP